MKNGYYWCGSHVGVRAPSYNADEQMAAANTTTTSLVHGAALLKEMPDTRQSAAVGGAKSKFHGLSGLVRARIDA